MTTTNSHPFPYEYRRATCMQCRDDKLHRKPRGEVAAWECGDLDDSGVWRATLHVPNDAIALVRAREQAVASGNDVTANGLPPGWEPLPQYAAVEGIRHTSTGHVVWSDFGLGCTQSWKWAESEEHDKCAANGFATRADAIAAAEAGKPLAGAALEIYTAIRRYYDDTGDINSRSHHESLARLIAELPAERDDPFPAQPPLTVEQETRMQQMSDELAGGEVPADFRELPTRHFDKPQWTCRPLGDDSDEAPGVVYWAGPHFKQWGAFEAGYHDFPAAFTAARADYAASTAPASEASGAVGATWPEPSADELAALALFQRSSTQPSDIVTEFRRVRADAVAELAAELRAKDLAIDALGNVVRNAHAEIERLKRDASIAPAAEASGAVEVEAPEGTDAEEALNWATGAAEQQSREMLDWYRKALHAERREAEGLKRELEAANKLLDDGHENQTVKGALDAQAEAETRAREAERKCEWLRAAIVRAQSLSDIRAKTNARYHATIRKLLTGDKAQWQSPDAQLGHGGMIADLESWADSLPTYDERDAAQRQLTALDNGQRRLVQERDEALSERDAAVARVAEQAFLLLGRDGEIGALKSDRDAAVAAQRECEGRLAALAVPDRCFINLRDAVRELIGKPAASNTLFGLTREVCVIAAFVATRVQRYRDAAELARLERDEARDAAQVWEITARGLATSREPPTAAFAEAVADAMNRLGVNVNVTPAPVPGAPDARVRELVEAARALDARYGFDEPPPLFRAVLDAARKVAALDAPSAPADHKGNQS